MSKSELKIAIEKLILSGWKDKEWDFKDSHKDNAFFVAAAFKISEEYADSLIKEVLNELTIAN